MEPIKIVAEIIAMLSPGLQCTVDLAQKSPSPKDFAESLRKVDIPKDNLTSEQVEFLEGLRDIVQSAKGDIVELKGVIPSLIPELFSVFKFSEISGKIDKAKLLASINNLNEELKKAQIDPIAVPEIK